MKPKPLNLILLSSSWKNSHRKGLHTHLHGKLESWSNLVFVQAPYSFLVHLLGKRKSFLEFSRGDSESNDLGLNLFTPRIIFHNKIWNKLPIALKIDNILISRQLKKYCRNNFGDCTKILWTCHPFDAELIGMFSPEMSVYDFYDNFSYEEDGSFNAGKNNLNCRLIENSDLVFATASVMFKFASAINPSSYLIPNGYSGFMLKAERSDRLKINGKVIGYLGNIRNWIDFELIKKVLESLAENGAVVFVGPVDGKVKHELSELKKYKNFVHIPEVQRTEVAEYISCFDIGIIPFHRNRFTDGVFPYKFFEYVACGIRIVTTDLPDMRQYDRFVNVASNEDEFVRMCTSDIESLNYDDSAYEHVLKDSSWESRSREINFLVRSMFEERDCEEPLNS